MRPALLRTVRRGFLPVTCLILCLSSSVPVAAGSETRFGLILDGEGVVGFVKRVSGGVVKAEVVTHELGREQIQKKNVRRVLSTPFRFEFALDMEPAFFDWMLESFEVPGVIRDGSLIATDPGLGLMNERHFSRGIITEVVFPKLETGDSSECSMLMTVDPAEIVYLGGEPIVDLPTPGNRTWLCSNFRLELGDLPVERVSKVDTFTWKQKVIKDEVGQSRFPDLEPTKVEIPNLKFTIFPADLGPWENWHRTFVIEGRNGDDNELMGKITYLGPDQTTVLGEIDLLHVGIISLESTDPDSNSEEIGAFEVELYVEEMHFRVSSDSDVLPR